MRRVILAFVATVVGLVVLLSFKTAPTRANRPVALSGSTPGSAPPESSAPESSVPESSAPASSGPTSPTPASSTPAASTPAAQAPKPATKPTPKPAIKPTPKPATATKVLTGSAVTVSEGFREFGTVQVQLTVTNGKITKVAELEVPQDDGHSAEISNYSIPILRKEVLAAQGAKIDIVSGATWTSEGYAQSVQSALDSAKS